MKYQGIAIVLSAFLWSIDTMIEAAEPLTVMSFNVRGDFDGGVPTDRRGGWLSNTGEHRRELALKLIADADPDVLGVQEAYRNQVEEIDAVLPGHDHVGVGRDDGDQAGEHCTIYYRRDRFESISSGTFWLSNEPDVPSTYPGAACPRIATWVILRDKLYEGQRLAVINTHWDHVSAEARQHSAELIRKRLSPVTGGLPAIVMGDLNVGESQSPIRTLLGDSDARLLDSYRLAYPERTDRERTSHGFDGSIEGTRIDYVLHTLGWRTVDAAIVRTSYDGVFPSDHYPVTATLVLDEK